MKNFSYQYSQTAKRLKRYNIRSVDMSIYGPTPDLHDKITGVKGSFNALINAIRFLRSYKIPVILKVTLFKDTFNFYREIQKLAEGLDVTNCFFGHIIIPMRDGSKKNRHMSISGKDFSNYMAFMNKDGAFTKMKNNKFARGKGDMLELSACSAAHNTFGINPYGELMPCILSQVSAGSLLKASFKDLWHNSSVLKQWREIKLKDIYKCNKCKLIAVCSICPAAQLLENRALKPVKAMCESSYFTDKYINENKSDLIFKTRKEAQNDKEDRKTSQEALCEANC